MQDNNRTFIKKMDALCVYFGAYTDQDLAKAMGVTRSAVAQWRFKKTIPKKIVLQYADAFDDTSDKEEIPESHLSKLIKLYEDKIELLEEKIRRFEEKE